MRQCMDAENLHRRLRKIVGQVNAIDKIMQINAAKSALHKCGKIVLEGHLNHCVREGIEHGDPDKTIKEFAAAIEHFSRLS